MGTFMEITIWSAKGANSSASRGTFNVARMNYIRRLWDVRGEVVKCRDPLDGRVSPVKRKWRVERGGGGGWGWF